MGYANSESINASLNRVVSRLNETMTRTTGISLSVMRHGFKVHTRLQVIFSLRFIDPVEAMLFELIMTHALQAERTGPGGFDMFVQNLLDNWTGTSTLRALKENLRSLDGSGNRPGNARDVTVLLDKYLDVETATLVHQALGLSGFGGRVTVEKARSAASSVELVRGYSFPLSPMLHVTATLEEPLIACIDGFIESVSELHLMLETVSSAKLPLLLFVRGMTDEVLHTLKVNYERGSLKVVPIKVPFDLEGINTLADIAIVAGSDVVSTTKGQVISTLVASDFVTIPKALVYQDRIVLVNPSSSDRVNNHVAQLRDRRAGQPDESLERLLDLRVKSLSPNQVIIRLIDDDRYVVKSQMIDYVLRGLKSLMDHGVIDDVPAASIVASKIQAIKCLESLVSLGAAITP